ncbi:hypothetical protein SLS62_002571 [Diatrype stigma]|uniref:Heterokaryon incompatibility domain-containing protein n=1 Tax=Diatrype stigma TaxID=117547 RepID=A0AAN9YVG0_9PEZI
MSVCSTIRFDPAWLSDHSPRQRRSVKSVRRNKSCAFCRLLARAMFEEQRRGEIGYENSRIVTWEWSDHVGPSGGFWIMNNFWSRTSICFGVPPNPDEELNRSYSLLSSRPPVINTDRIKGWIKRCVEGHGAECGGGVDEEKRRPRRNSRLLSTKIHHILPGLEILRLIDVERKCLVEVQVLEPYVCLSYVWGSTAALRLTQANLELLLEDGALMEAKQHIPTTLLQAMYVCSKIGQRYLWVDALCLIQNDPRDLKLGIEVMDLIYEKADLTIIAASGDNANAGLPGVAEGTRMPSKPLFEVAPSVQLGVHVGLEQHLAASTYRTRAWTLVIPPGPDPT